MPFIRQTRDKRGFEQTYVMHAYRSPTGDGSRTRVLYVFRTPANLRIGRTPLDPEVCEALEHTHPDLTFDWQSLTREMTMVRQEPSAPRGQRPIRARDSRGDAAVPPAQPADSSPLGRAVGAAEARRLRGRFRELEERIPRRARTPEERDRLFERLRRLNPDSWTDAAAIPGLARDAGREFDAIAAELPSRRRGRRSGRGRGRPEGSPGASGIMAGEQSHADQEQETDRPLESDGARDLGHDGGHDGDRGAAGPAGPADADLPNDD